MTSRTVSILLAVLLLAAPVLMAQSGPPGAVVNNLRVPRTQPDVVFAATQGGVFRSTDGGRTWQNRSAGLPAVAVNDVDGPSWRLYAGVEGGGVWVSINGGLWTETTNVFGGANVFAVAVHPDNPMLVVTATAAGIFRTTNGGVSWDEPSGSLPDTPIADIEFSPTDPERVIAVGPQRVYDSEDGGSSWEPTVLTSLVFRIEFDPGNPGRYYLATSQGLLFRNSPTGSLFVLSALGTISILNIAVDPGDSLKLYASSESFGILRSVNAGGDWSGGSNGLPNGFGFGLVTIPSEPGRVLVGLNGSGVFASPDQGNNWSLSSTGMRASTVRAMAVSPIDSQTVWAALDGGGLFKSTNGGESWAESREGYFNRGPVAFEVDPLDPDRLYVGSVDPVDGTSGGLAISADGGETWVQSPSSRDYRALAVDPVNGNFVLAGGSADFFSGRDGFVWSGDFAETFNLGPQQSFAQFNVFDLSFAPSSSSNVWAIANTSGIWSLWISPDRGFTYAGPFLQASTRYVQVDFDPTDEERVYVTTDGAGLVRSQPGGDLEAANEGLPNEGAVSVGSLAISPDTPSNLLIATNFGVYRSTDFGGNWELSEDGLPAAETRRIIMASGGVAYAATRARGFYVSSDNGATWEPVGLTALSSAGIVHGANFRNGALAPSQIVSIFGGPFTDELELATSRPLPKSLAGVTVTVVDGVGESHGASLFFASSGQINIEVPGDSVAGAGQIVVHFKDGTEASVPVQIGAVNPGLFASAGTGEGPAAASAVRIGDGGVQTPVDVTTFSDGQHRTVPITIGEGQDPVVLLLFGSGLRGFSTVQAFVNGVEVTVFGVAAQSEFVGLDQANIDLPASLAGSGVVEVYLVVDGVRTNSVLIELQ